MFDNKNIQKQSLPLRLTKRLDITYNDQNIKFGNIPNQLKFIKTTSTKNNMTKNKQNDIEKHHKMK